MHFRHMFATLLLAAPALAQDPQQLARRADAEADLGFAVVRQLPPDEDLLLSPHSISKALEMAYAGARGETLAELARLLGVEGAPLVDLDAALATRGKGARGRDGQPFRLRSVQAAFAHRAHPFRQEYVDELTRRHRAEVRQVDFEAEREAARDAINAWISEATERKIPRMLDDDQPSGATRLVLVNAVYFNAAWESPFQEQATRPRPFQLASGERVDAPTMVAIDHFRHATVDGVRAVALPYSGRETSMLVLVPDDLAAFTRDLSAARVRSIVDALQVGYLDLRLPKFAVRSRLDLKAPLQATGLRQAFESGVADFSGMDGTKDLFIGLILHEAVAEVDERGTEAAAATLVGMDGGGMPPEPTPFHVDRPYLLLIRDDATGAVLFMGRVLDPR